MRKTNKNKKQIKAKQSLLADTSREEDEHVTLTDTAISIKSSSLIVSTLFLFSLTVIILALAMIIGLVSYVYSYNFAEKSRERYGFRTGNFEEIVSFQEDAVGQENEYIALDEDVEDADTSDSTDQNELDDKDDETEEDSVVKTYVHLENRNLFYSYKFDFEKASKLRQEGMKKYSYPYSIDGVDKRSNLSLQEYYDVYDGKWPVIVTDVIPTWPASNWSMKGFKDKYGQARVAMLAYNIKEDTVFTGGKEGYSVPLGIFLEHVNASIENSWTYVQDEVFLAQFPELRAQVLNTIYAQEDFFNLFPKEIRPWDCLFLWGTAHSRSTLHIDPYNWTGTNAVISGHKKWRLLPPGQDGLLAVQPNAGCGFPLECQKYNSKYDTYSKSDQMKRKLKKLKYLEVDQFPGEMLFLPTGWFHQAYNVKPTLAVSGEIMNRNNYLVVLEEIFHARNLPRSILPRNVEVMAPEELVMYVMARMPEKILRFGAKWTQHAIDNLDNPSIEREVELDMERERLTT